MRAWRERIKAAEKQDNRGLSLVEILCAVAIFSLIAVAIGTVVVFSARTFNKGITETSLQQEAQVAANQIGTIVQDACEARFDSDAKTLTLKTNEVVGVGESATNKTYTISLDNDKKELLYSDGTMFDAKLAENIEYFHVGTDDFEKSNTVYLTMRVKNGEKVYNVQYAISARNQMTADIPDIEVSKYRSILHDSYVIMTPGENGTIPFTVSGEKPRIGMEASFHNDFSGAFDIALDSANVTIPTDASGIINLYIRTKDTDPRAETCIPIRVRRVTNVAVTHTRNTAGVDENSSGNSYEAAGCVYTFYARVNADYSERQIGAYYDENYKNPRAVEWKVTTDGAPINMSEYFDIQPIDDKSVPSLKVTIKKDLPSGLRVTALATSKHANGVNKGGVSYYKDDIKPPAGYDSVTKADGTKNDIEKGSSEQWGYDSFTTRDTKIDSQTIILEPYESVELPITIKGGKPLQSDVTTVCEGVSDKDATAYFDVSNSKLSIKLGKDAKGTDYSFNVIIKVKGKDISTTKVLVRRVDSVSLCEDGSISDKKEEDAKPNTSYNFNVFYNADSLAASKSIVSGVADSAMLNTKFSWELKKGFNTLKKGEVCTNDLSAFSKVTTDYFDIESVTPAGVTDQGEVSQFPAITVKIKDKGLPDNSSLTITAQALHPTGGAYNRTTQNYHDDSIEDSFTLLGKQDFRLSIPADYVIVEPGQGNDDNTKGSDDELGIPITVEGRTKVYKMTAEITGKTSSGTRLSEYYVEQDGNKVFNNPYWSSTQVGENTAEVWWLGLVIGANEKGEDMKVTVRAYDSEGKEIVQAVPLSFDLKLRRVKQVELAVADNKNISTLNKAGAVITLEASVSGVDGIKYFDEQKDREGKTCRWETSGHGLYKSPAPIKWTMEYKKTEKPLGEWTDYFETVNEPVTDHQNYRSSITFKLKKALPSGAILRATSLHAKGAETEGATTKYYNKAGKTYDDVCGEIKIGSNIIVAEGFQRADEYTFVSNIPNLRSSYFNDDKYKSLQRSFYRYREVDGAWSQYYLMDDASENIARVTGYQTARIFLPDKEYELDIVNVVYSEEKKVIYWPLDESLLEPGKGWKEEGFSLYQWDTSVMTEEEKNFQYEHVFLIPKTEIFFEPCYNQKQTISGTVRSIGSDANPLNLKTGDSFAAGLAPTAFNLQKTQYYFTAILQKKVDGKWVTISQDNMQNVEHWFLQTHCPSFSLYNIYDQASGNYRICTTLKDMEWMKVQGGLFEPKYVSYTMDTPLYDFADDTGVLYLKFN